MGRRPGGPSSAPVTPSTADKARRKNAAEVAAEDNYDVSVSKLCPATEVGRQEIDPLNPLPR